LWTKSILLFRPGSADLLSDRFIDQGGLNHNTSVGGNSVTDSNDLITIPITKGGMGFGFTIADSAFGQKVKKILDRPRCKNLQEGDILVEINTVNVRGMSHSGVVQVRSINNKVFNLSFIFVIFPLRF
jgi:hypothetical protein